MRLQGVSHVPTTPLVSLVELHQAIVVDDIEQVYVVTPIHSFLFAIESVNYSSVLNNVSIIETINEKFLKAINKNKNLVETLF